MRAINHNADINGRIAHGPALPFIPANPPIQGQAPYMSAADHQLFHAIACADEADFVSLMTAAITDGARLDAIDEAGNGVIEVAIQRNSLRIVQALLARGAPLPIVPPSGFDQVMRAAAQGNPDIVSLLIDTEEMLPDATDASGCSALHYAVLSRSARTVEVLLQRGADCNRAAVDMPEARIEAIFGTRHGLSGEDITPLNIAVALHQIPVVRVLLEHGAAVNLSWRNALWIAVNRHDSVMLGVLLSHCVTTGQVTSAINQAVLESTLLGDPRTDLLRQLLDCHDAQSNDAIELDTALLVAVNLGHVDQAALLLAEGASPEPASEADKPIWSAALEQEDDAMLNLLIASCHIPFGAMLLSQPDAPPRLLTDLHQLVNDPISLATNGIFPAMIRSAVPQLSQLADTDEAVLPAQRAVATALMLWRCLPGIQRDRAMPESGIATGNTPSHAHLIPVAEFQHTLAAARHAQSETISAGMTIRLKLMSSVATDALNSLRMALTTSLAEDFLRGARQRADGRGTEFFITHTLTEVHGLPGSLARLIAQTWSESERVIGSELRARAMPDHHAISRRMSLTLYCKLDAVSPAPDSLLHYCHDVLTHELLATRAPVLNLLRHPANFLRALEHRQGWRPVNFTVLSRLILEATGLPIALCNGITACWQKAVSEVADDTSEDRHNQGANQRFHSLDRRFASYWQNWLEENAVHAGEAVLPLTPEEVLMALAWCENMRSSAPVTTTETRKRKPGGEADGAPPTKSPRTE